MNSLEDAMLATPPVPGRYGRVLIADRETLLADEVLPELPPRDIVRVARLPYVLPLLEQAARQVAHVVAVVDRRGSDIYAVDSSGAVVGETVQGEGHPLHKIRHGGGWSAWSIQHRVDEKIRRNIDEVAREVTRLAEQVRARVIVIGGEVTSRAALADALPAHGAEVVQVEAGARAAGADQAEFDEQVRAIVSAKAEQEQHSVLEKFATESGRPDGLAVAGLAATTAALAEANVDQLLINEVALGDRLVRTEPAPIHPVDEAQVATGDTRAASICRADEALPVAALNCGAAITPVDEAGAIPEGVGALLRHR
ncbi:Vms1/Ankzf1 family peptidyl-tRNA hydrolase [Nocardia brasiliensis]|uniref:baeRF2 domain-containing protein n=1 Tax=Nocardia brasiliensis TaxID=37326 RepID=UPI003672E9E5